MEDKRQIIENIYEKYVNFVTTTAVPKSLTIDDISKQDKFLQNLRQRIENDDCNLLKKLNFDNETLNLLKWYRKLKDTLKINLDSDIILKDNRIILLEIFNKTLVKLAHIVHHGIQKTKALMRSKVFFLRMDSIIENKITNCVHIKQLVDPTLHQKSSLPRYQKKYGTLLTFGSFTYWQICFSNDRPTF